MRTLCWWSLVGAATLALVGCGGSTPTSPANFGADYTKSDVAVEQGGQIAQIAGAYRIELDIAKQTAKVTPIARQGNAIGDLFYLNVDNFGVVVAPAPTDTFTNLDLIGNTIDFNYQVAHSFPAPSNPSGTASAANRADLGVSGRVVFLVDAPATVDDPSMDNHVDDYTFSFGGSNITLNPKAILNADGYYDPAAMLTGFHTATNGTNAWPSKALVDEGADARVGVSNGGSSTGNYGTTQSWGAQSAWTGGPNVTGYGVLHQGQTATNSVTLNIAPGNSITLDAVVICNYTDPRGGANSAEKRANRLPKNDTALFAYRMPHGASDLESVSIGNLSGTLGAAAASTITADVTVVDQDFATTVGPGLTEIPNASGIATIDLAAGELGAQTPAFGTPTGTGSAEDPVVYTGATITNTDGVAGGVDAGAYVCVQLVDEQDAAAAGFEAGITLDNSPVPMPVASGSQHPIVYQVAFVDIV
jgi:hypothetical protein